MASPEQVFETAAEVSEASRVSHAKANADAALGEWLREDPQAAAPAVYDRFAADVNRWVWRLMGADPDHSDVVQQVFVRVIRSATRLRDVERLAPWIHAIAVNTVYGELRRRDVRRLFLRDHGHAQAHADLVRDVEMRDLLLHAKALIEKLPRQERIVFLLHFAEGRTLPEIAELCGYSTATAKRRLASASRRFEALLAGRAELSRLLEKFREER